jgi:hypothetical protein
MARWQLMFEREDASTYVKEGDHFGDIPLAIRYNCGKVAISTDGNRLQGEAIAMVAFQIKGDVFDLHDLIPSACENYWSELGRMANDLPDDFANKYNVLNLEQAQHVH